MELGLVILRLVIGALFVGHGAQKVFGAFGGPGLGGTGQFMESLGYRPGRPHAALAGWTELVSGSLLVLGLLTPLAAAGIVGVMLNAIVAVHLGNGLWVSDGGVEYPLVVTVAAVGLVLSPSGFSLDAAFGLELGGFFWGAATLVIGASAATVALSSRATEDPSEILAPRHDADLDDSRVA